MGREWRVTFVVLWYDFRLWLGKSGEPQRSSTAEVRDPVNKDFIGISRTDRLTNCCQLM